MQNETSPTSGGAATASAPAPGETHPETPVDTRSEYEIMRDEQQRERARRKTRQSELADELRDMSNGLALAITGAYNGPHSLLSQTKMLNHMLAAVTRSCLDDTIKSGDFDQKWLDFALRLQRQSMDTAKAFTAIEYMQTLTEACHRNMHGTSKETAHPLPHPPETGEQNEGMEE